MKLLKYPCLSIGLLILLTSCDFLGIGRHSKDNKKRPLPKAKLAWQVQNTGDLASPAPFIEDGSAYVAGDFTLAKLSLKDGSTQWTTPLEGSAIFGSILADNNTLYLRFEKSVKVFNKADGSSKWSLAFDDSLGQSELAAGTSLINQSDKFIFIGIREKLLVVDKQQGTVKQTITPDVPVQNASVQQFNVPLASKSGGLVYLLTSYKAQTGAGIKGHVAAYHTTDGSMVWESTLPYQLPHIGSFQSPTLQITQVKDRVLVMTGPAVIALDAQTGKQIWTHLFVAGRTDANIGRLLVAGSNSVYAAGGKQILKLAIADGERIWEISTVGIIDRMLAAGGHIYFSSSISPLNLSIYAADVDTGEESYSIMPPQQGGPLDAFTPAFDANGSSLIDVGVTGIYGYELPE